MEKTILLRYGELSLKAPPTRRFFEKRLVLNLKDALQRADAEGEVRTERGRVFIDGGGDKAASAASRVFGVVSLSPAFTTTFTDLEELSGIAAEFAADRIKKGESFAIRPRRAGSHPFTSMEIGREAGAAVVEKTKADVDLGSPDREIFVEVRDNSVYLFTEKVDGPGGLPLGVEGRVLALLSGGMDSPVAAWQMMRRGCEVDFVHFSLAPFTARRSAGRIDDVLKVMAGWENGYRPKAFYVSHGPSLKEFMETASYDHLCLLCKRAMYRIAERLAAKRGALALVTGESLGQVASQTLPNLSVIDASVRIPVLRPLIGWDKNEIAGEARRIGVLEGKTKPVGCCTAAPPHPETDAKLQTVEDEESFADVEALLEEEMETVEEVDVASY